MESCAWKVSWDDAMSVGIPEVDQEHRQFIQSISDLNLAIAGRMELAEIKHRIQRIIDHAGLHFAHEEMLLKQWNYPGADDHASKHARISQALQKIMLQCTKDSLEPQWIAAGLEVKNILVSHLVSEDMKYMDYFHRALGDSGSASTAHADGE